MLETCDLVDWMRNNVGHAVIDGRHVSYGLGGPGGSDLIGIVRGTGRLIACEVKRPGMQPTEKQRRYLDRVRRANGIALVATCPEDVRECLR